VLSRAAQGSWAEDRFYSRFSKPAMKKYIVRLSTEEQAQLSQMIRRGKAAARALLPARILLQADTGLEAPAGSDEAIGEALEGPATTVARVRQRFVEEGLEAALRPQPTMRRYECKRDGPAEAHLLALACGPAPEGQTRWTLRLLADQLVELRQVPSISHETIRQVLKKTNYSRTGSNTGRFHPSTMPPLWPRWKTC
jgi:Homeodomain-like domain